MIMCNNNMCNMCNNNVCNNNPCVIKSVIIIHMCNNNPCFNFYVHMANYRTYINY